MLENLTSRFFKISIIINIYFTNMMNAQHSHLKEAVKKVGPKGVVVHIGEFLFFQNRKAELINRKLFFLYLF